MIAEQLAPAMDHLEQDGQEGDEVDVLTIWAWDDVAVGAAAPEPPLGPRTSGMVYHNGSDLFCFDIPARRIEAYDIRNRVGLFRVPDGRLLSARDQAAPFLRIFHWWSLSEGFHMVHGAAVGTIQGAALLVGHSGSGKSTTSLSCIDSGLQFLADDSTLIEPGPLPMVHSLYSSGKADPRSMSMLPHLAGEFMPVRNDSKAVVFLAERHPGGLLTKAPLRAIILPSFSGAGRWEVSPAAPSDALRALAPSTIFQMPGGKAESFARMAALVRAIPCWTLRLGADPMAAVPVLLDILTRSGPS